MAVEDEKPLPMMLLLAFKNPHIPRCAKRAILDALQLFVFRQQGISATILDTLREALTYISQRQSSQPIFIMNEARSDTVPRQCSILIHSPALFLEKNSHPGHGEPRIRNRVCVKPLEKCLINQRKNWHTGRKHIRENPR